MADAAARSNDGDRDDFRSRAGTVSGTSAEIKRDLNRERRSPARPAGADTFWDELNFSDERLKEALRQFEEYIRSTDEDNPGQAGLEFKRVIWNIPPAVIPLHVYGRIDDSQDRWPRAVSLERDRKGMEGTVHVAAYYKGSGFSSRYRCVEVDRLWRRQRVVPGESRVGMVW